MTATPLDNRTVYLAADGFTDDLVHELEAYHGVRVHEVRGRVVVAEGHAQPAAWAQNVWLEPVLVPVASIGDAARQLKAIQRNWRLHATGHHRRAALIQEQLPRVAARPLRFGDTPPASALGSWTLWEHDLVLASARCSSPFPDGEPRFEENRTDPPTRAYLKLWELFTVTGARPAPGQLCLDLGSCPGGWTWVLAELGARVFSVDKAALAPHIARHPNVNFCTGSAFGLDPRHAGRVDWLFSDVICYPDRLLATVGRWLELGQCRNFVCTLKFQSATDHATARAFAAIPGSRLLHLAHNKHELTWMLLRD